MPDAHPLLAPPTPAACLPPTPAVNVLKQVQACPTVARIFCATANPTAVVVGRQGERRGILGVLDGLCPVAVEDDAGAFCLVFCFFFFDRRGRGQGRCACTWRLYLGAGLRGPHAPEAHPQCALILSQTSRTARRCCEPSGTSAERDCRRRPASHRHVTL